ncbi:MAG: leucine-rich repeat protein [Eubacterium sp.]|nr:leucine-rich repeat protein [Eubacterium sp.]
MKMGRRILAVLTALCIAAGVIVWPVGTKEVRAEVFEDFEYVEISNKTVEITKYTGADAEVVIPDEIDGKTVVSIGESAFEKCSGLVEITIPAGLRDIKDLAFLECIDLTKVNAPNNYQGLMHSIGVSAFSGCKNLSELDYRVLSNLENVGGLAFGSCEKLMEISLYSLGNIKIGNNAFTGCSSLTSIDISAKTVDIELRAFLMCTSLSRIFISGETVSLGNMAFQYCRVLTEVDLSVSGQTSIGDAVFMGCTNLERIDFLDNVTSMGERVFQGCTGLRNISLPPGVESIGRRMFAGCSNLRQIRFSSGVASIGDNAFLECDSLNDVYYIGTQQEWENIQIDTEGNENLARASIHYLNADDPMNDFEYRVLSDDTLQILKYKKSVEVLQIPEQIYGKTVTSIGFGASLETANSLMECKMKELRFPSTVVHIEESEGARYFGSYPALETIYVDENNPMLSSENGVLYDKPKGFLYKYPEAKGGEYDMPSTVSIIDIAAFSGCSNLTRVSISPNVTRIDDYTFGGCSMLREIEIPESVSVLGEGSFSGCTSLESIILPAGITEIGVGAFILCNSLKAVTIPQNVSKIEETTFLNCQSLAEITIPLSVTEINDSAFAECWQLKDVYYAGTLEQWKAIRISEEQNDDLLDAVVHLSDGTIFEGSKRKYQYKELDDGTLEITGYEGLEQSLVIPSTINGKSVTSIGYDAFSDHETLKTITIPSSVNKLGNLENGDLGCFGRCRTLEAIHVEQDNEHFSSENGILFSRQKDTLIRYPAKKGGTYTVPSGVVRIENGAFADCESLTEAEIPQGVKSIGAYGFMNCKGLASITIPAGIEQIEAAAFYGCSGLQDVYYSGIKAQWDEIAVDSSPYNGEENANAALLNAVIHLSDGTTINGPQDTVPEEVVDARQELEKLKEGDPLSLETDFSQFMTAEQIDVVESCLYTWLAQIDFAYQYSGSSGVKERVMKKAGIDPQGDFAQEDASETEQAVTHICVETQYGTKTLEITLDLGKPDGSGSLYPAYGSMHYEILEKGNLPSSVPAGGKIGKDSYADMAAFIKGVKKAAGDSLHNTYQWQSLDDEITACVLVDKTAAEIIGNKNGSFFDGTFTVYAEPLFAYHKIVKISGSPDVNVYIYGMDGHEAGSIVDNKPGSGEQKTRRLGSGRAGQDVQVDISGSTKTVYLAGDDYYLRMQGTGAGRMNYEVEEIANEEVRRNVQFLELQLEKDMQYEGYVFRPLNIDRDTYALRTSGSEGEQVIYANKDSYKPGFQKIHQLSISQQSTSLSAGRTMQLSAGFQPSDAGKPDLEWTTDNASAASVDGSGLVTAEGNGRAVITVSTTDGSFLRQSCVVEVSGGNGTGGNGTGGSGGSGGSSNGTGGISPPAAGGGDTPVVVSLHYIVQFDANGGTDLSRRTMTLLKDDSPGIMPKVRRRDHLFDGWYTAQDGGTQVSGDQPLNEALTLYARWTKVSAPAAPALTLGSKKKGRLQAGIQNVNGAAGYEIDYSLNKNFAAAKTKKAGTAAGTKTITGLKAGKKYYVRVRAYALDSMKNKIYGDYSEVKSIKIKK